MQVTPVHRRLRQEDSDFKNSLGYRETPCLKKIRTEYLLINHSCLIPMHKGGSAFYWSYWVNSLKHHTV